VKFDDDEEHVVFECPLYAPLRQKHKKLFEQAQDLSSVCQSPLAARFIYECYLMHAEFVAEVYIGPCLSPLSHFFFFFFPGSPLDGN